MEAQPLLKLPFFPVALYISYMCMFGYEYEDFIEKSTVMNIQISTRILAKYLLGFTKIITLLRFVTTQI